MVKKLDKLSGLQKGHEMVRGKAFLLSGQVSRWTSRRVE